ncbi:MAG: anthranilate phosphoribosyltransferase [Candidatus Levybacteria bacterium]|nr:anthranilate phosphoribosyltransferase [Candidatus Levybacteria bacterium]
MKTELILNKLMNKQDLTAGQAGSFLSEVMEGNVSCLQIGAVLAALRIKGESVEEITGFVKAMRANMVNVKVGDAIDVCGTGGDGIGTFNISTAVSFVVAGAGVKVAKHGNRAASSICGSADVLEELGVNINLSARQAQDVFKKTGFVFLFAPLFHPTMKAVGQVRKELKIRTIFNYLGPFANPANVKKQLIGVPNKEIAKKLCDVGKKLSYEHLVIVTSIDGLDEASIFSKTIMYDIKKNKVKKIIVDPEKFGFGALKKDVLGGSAKQNAQILKEILEGVKNPKRDIVVFNSAFALYAADVCLTIKEGIKIAQDSIDSGRAKKVLENLVKETQKYA